DLAGVRATPAGAVEVHRAGGTAAPEGVALVVDVHVGRELALQPRVRGQITATHLLDAIQLVEAAARRVGVAGRMAGRNSTVGAGAFLEIEVPGRRRLIDGAAVVVHAHVLAVERGAQRPWSVP